MFIVLLVIKENDFEKEGEINRNKSLPRFFSYPLKYNRHEKNIMCRQCCYPGGARPLPNLTENYRQSRWRPLQVQGLRILK